MTEATVEEVEQTPEEKEKEAQEQDKVQAEEEAKASEEKLKALAEAGPWSEVRRHRGVGPLVLETRRGAIKVFSGDIVVKHTPKAPEGEEKPEDKMARLAKADYLVFTAEQFAELAGLEDKDLPEDPFYRAIAIGEARRKAASETPATEPSTPSTQQTSGGSTPPSNPEGWVGS